MQRRERDELDGPVTGFTFGEQFLDALGLGSQANRITRVQLTVEAGEVVTLTMTQCLTARQGLAVCRLLTGRFDLVQRGTWSEQPIKPDGSEQDPGRP